MTSICDDMVIAQNPPSNYFDSLSLWMDEKMPNYMDEKLGMFPTLN